MTNDRRRLRRPAKIKGPQMKALHAEQAAKVLGGATTKRKTKPAVNETVQHSEFSMWKLLDAATP